jgi:hypothetical protein
MGTDLLPFDEVAALVATASALGILLLAPLFLSLRRDVERLRGWMLENPEHPRTDLALSEARLDKTEVELERIYGTPSAATRVTSERPALERITMERSALEPHHQLRRFSSRALQPRWLAALAVAAFVVAGAAIIVVQQGLLSDDDGGQVTAVDPSGIEVAVLNTTQAGGLAGRVSRQIEDAGFLPGAVESFIREADQTVVMYQRGQQRAAKRVARELGGAAVQKIDREVQAAAPSADVAVILGQDRVGG